jgi:drug/metabolite transporter (DMT)-like permease
MTHTQAILLMIVGAAMWSIGGVVSRFFESADGFEVTFWRSLFAALTVAAWLALRRGRRAFVEVARAEGIVWLSGAMWAVMFTCFMLALSLTQVANVLITQSLAPVVTALLAWAVLGQRVGVRTWAAITVAALGICAMYVFDVSALDGRHALGVLVALGIPLAAGINWVLVQRAGRGPDLSMAVLIGGVISMVCTLPLAWPLDANAHDLMLLAVLGVFQLGIPCVLVMHVARYLTATETSLLALLEVVFGILLTWVFGGERPGWATLLGGCAVLGALVYHELAVPTGPSRQASEGPRQATAP